MVVLIVDLLLGGKYGIIESLTLILGVNPKPKTDPTMWYISFLFFWYIIFCLVFKFTKRNLLRVILLFLVTILLSLVSNFIWNPEVGAVLYVFLFPMGVALAIFNKQITTLSKWNGRIGINIIMIFSGISNLLMYGKINNSLVYMINIIIVTIFIITLCISRNVESVMV